MTNEKIKKILKIAYQRGRDNGSGRSEKNFNDLLQIKEINKILNITDVVLPKGTLCPSCGEDKSIEDWEFYYRCKLCDTKF